MKKLTLFLLLNIFFLHLFSQDTVRLKHTNYTTVFSKSKKYPVLVEWWVTKKRVTCASPIMRTDNFERDPLLPKETDLLLDYKGSGYDRGHMCPAADNQCDGIIQMNECFYFSNMTPQPHKFNAGIWKTLETETRNLSVKLDSIHVWSGALGGTKIIGPSKMLVPIIFWKVLYIKKNNEWRYYIFKDTLTNEKDINKFLVTKIEFQKLTGFNL